jgi:hypothetical protein
MAPSGSLRPALGTDPMKSSTNGSAHRTNPLGLSLSSRTSAGHVGPERTSNRKT